MTQSKEGLLRHDGRGIAIPTRADCPIGEQVASVLADLGYLAQEPLPGAHPEHVARMCERLAEELAEVAAMIRALPGEPGEAAGHTFAARSALVTAARRERDFTGWLVMVLCGAAGDLGCAAEVAESRSCWEVAQALTRGRGTGPTAAPAASRRPATVPGPARTGREPPRQSPFMVRARERETVMIGGGAAPAEVLATVRAVIADLSQVCERLCTQPAQAEPAAGILNQLATEIGEAARVLRTPAQPTGTPRE